MNKQELIEKYEKLEGVCKDPGAEIARLIFLEDLRELDELQKVQVPQFVADWYEANKDDFEYNVWDWISSKDEPEKIQSEFAFWVNDAENNPIQTLVNMHQFGYTVEKEPKYTVKIKSVNQYLVRNTDEDFLGFLQSRLKSKFTRKELEEAGLSDVFNSPLFEVEEVEE